MRFGARLTTALLLVASIGAVSEAQTVRQSTRPHAATTRSHSSGAGTWWDGQVRSFQRRWGLAPKKRTVVKKTQPAARTSPVQTAAYRGPVQHAAYAAGAPQQHGIQPVVHRHAYSPQAGTWMGPAPPAPVAAPSRSAPQDPATAGLMPGYPQFRSALYPSPRPDIPYYVGGTAITNQALAPHEMLYPHEYRALYPPFYYRVRGGWVVTPWGVMSSDRWELLGTEVRVKYKSHISPLSGFMPPVHRWNDDCLVDWNENCNCRSGM